MKIDEMEDDFWSRTFITLAAIAPSNLQTPLWQWQIPQPVIHAPIPQGI